MSPWRRVYGDSPLHLLGQLVALAITAYAVTQIIDVASTDNLSLLIWFAGGALLHDLILLPIYVLLDLAMRLGVQDHALRRVRVINHVRFPVAICGVMLLALFPLILGRSKTTYAQTAGEQPPDYLGRWLLICVVVFGASALAYVVRVRRDATRRTRIERDDASTSPSVPSSVAA